MKESRLLSSLGVQSWCLRAYKERASLIEAVKGCGLDNLELCDVHYDPTKEENHEACLKEYKDNGIRITGFGVCYLDDQEWRARKVFDFCRAAGVKMIGVSPKDGSAINLIESLCDEYGMVAGVHNHGRKDRWGSVRELESLFSATTKNIGLFLDTAWMMDSAEDPLAVAGRFEERLYGVHIKDFVFNRAGVPEDVVVGEGNLDLEGLMRLLLRMDFQGLMTLEYEGDEQNPLPAINRCVENIRRTFETVGE